METRILFLLLIMTLILSSSCSKKTNEDPIQESEFIRSVDLSSFPKIESKNLAFFNFDGIQEELITTLKNSGVNVVRLRIWNNPSNKHNSFDEVATFSHRLKNLGFKVWITIHYSDTWADPGNQTPPSNWQSITYAALKDSVYRYTEKIVREIDPEYIQIGNEINSGLLFPYGNITSNESQFIELISTGIDAIRDNSNDTKIIIHFAGLSGSNWFFGKVKNVDYDIIGLSYYPIWHGKDINQLKTTLSNLVQSYNKEIIIAETAYPFTLGWNDWTNNIVGLETHLILPDFPATNKGQKNFISKIREIVESTNKGIGFCYWGGELIAFDGPESENGSPWENQALYDFNNKALPVMNDFYIE